jgi:hypothetical protein
VEGEHLTVEVLADGDFVTTFGMWDGEGVGNLNLFCLRIISNQNMANDK